MKLSRLTLKDFNWLADRLLVKTNITDRALEMARDVLVSGRTQSEVANERKVFRQRVHSIVGLFEQTYVELPDQTNCLVKIELEVAKPLALELKQLAKMFLSCKDEKLRASVLANTIQGLRSSISQLQQAQPQVDQPHKEH